MAKSAVGSIVPLIITFLLLAIVGVIGFIAYQIATDVADKTSKRMEKKNMSFSKDGLKVGVKEVSAEQVGDSTQNVLMKAWNASHLDPQQPKSGRNSPASASGANTEKHKLSSRTQSQKT